MKNRVFNRGDVFRIIVVLALAVGMTVLPEGTAHAATLTVTTATDESDHSCVDGDCSLRDAIEVAVAGDTIIFDAALSGATINLSSTLTLYKNVTIDGSALASKITISGQNTVRVMWVNAGVTATLNSLIITRGYTAGNGAGIYNEGALTIRNSILSGNRAPTKSIGSGGAIYNNTGGTVTIDTSTLSGNYAYGWGGAIYNNGTFTGGGNSIVIFNSALYNNTVTNAFGGAIYNFGSNLTVINTTLAANSAYRGGAIYSEYNSNLWLRNATIAGNTATAGPVGNGGGGLYNTGSQLYFINTIISNNSGYDCYSTVPASENGYNLVQSSKLYYECKQVGDVLDTRDPLLGPLTDNGGPTLTMALGDGSPAIDGGNDGTCAVVNGVNNRDQRGVVRPLGAHCDIGAYEYAPKNITAFSFASPAATGVIAGTSITVNLPYGTDRSSLVPSITYVGASINPLSGVAQNFTSPVTYTVTAADATTKVYTVTVSACDPTGVVTNANDDGAGSLRRAILAACPGGTITFNGDYSINLTSAELTVDKNLTINGSGHTVSISGQNARRVFTINNGVTATLNNLEITQGYAGGSHGGGIWNDGALTLSNSKVTASKADSRGGGIFNSFTGTLTIIASTVSGNTAGSITTAGLGGGVCNNGTLTVIDSTISGNTAGTDVPSYGGGIYITASTTATILNSTISSNLASAGGGIVSDSGSSVTIANSTIAANSALGATPWGGGGIVSLGTTNMTNSTLSGNTTGLSGTPGGLQNGGTLHYANTIIANSVGGADCGNSGGTIGTNTNNLVEDGSCSASLTGDPKLGTLQDNGGSTWTMAIDATSSAFDTGSAAICAAAPVSGKDQRGISRPQGSVCDIGAFEFNPLPVLLSFTRQTPATSPTGADTLVFRATFSENMQNVDTTDFQVNSTSTATVTAVSAVTGTSVYNVTVSGGDLANYNGTVGLNLRGTQNIQDLAGSALPNGEPSTDETYTVFNALAPTDIGLSNTMLEENLPVGTLVGTLSTVDPNVGDSHTYSLVGGVPGCNGADNASFQISGNQLLTSAVFSYATKSSYAICVRTTDSTSLNYNEAFTITVTATKAITSFTIPGQISTTTINNTAGTIALAVPYGTDVTSLVPTITHTGASISPASGVANDFSSPATYIITGADSTTKNYTVTVTIACSSNITVTNANDNGVGSLRQAMTDLCSGGIITFDNDYTIPLASTLTITKDMLINGTGHSVALDGQGGVRVLEVGSGVTAFLNELTIENGAAPGSFGGGILNNGTLTVSNSTLSGNTAAYGGAIDNYSSAILIVTNSSFQGNTASDAGGAVMSYYEMTVTGSTFSGNSVTEYGSIGGAIHDAGGTLAVTNSTFYGNHAGSNDISHLGMGGALSVSGNGTLTVTNSTLAGNTSSFMGSGIYAQSATLNYSNTIISGDAPTFYPGYYLCEVDYLGTNSHNLVQDGSCSSALSGDPTLGSLQDNGGPTWTMMPLTGSAALNGGDSCPVADQRGVSRPQGSACDIGAVEVRSQKDITAFAFTSPAATGVITGTNIAITVPYLTDVTALVPTITHTGVSVSPASGVAQDFTNPVTYTVTAEDGSTQDYSVTVTVSDPVNIGNFVWNDANNNGAVDSGETGINGILLRLFHEGDDPSTDTPVAATTTASESGNPGYYHFDNLAPGTYFVYIPTPPIPYPVSSIVTVTTNDGLSNIDNDDNGIQNPVSGTVVGAPVRSPNITLTADGETTTDGDGSDGDLTIDFGFAAVHTVTFDANLGSGTMSPQTGYSPAALTLNAFTRTDYTFTGWSATPTGAVVYADGATYDFLADVTLYAHWTDAIPPTVTGVTSTSNSGCLLNAGTSYCNVPDVVHIQIAFSEAVNVADFPQLALNSGGTATYVSGTGTDTLTFDYTVAAGESVSDLDYTSTGALTLNGGTIRDAATNDATMTLPAPGQPGSLGANANIVIDTAAPTVSSIVRYSPATTPTNADVLEFNVTFSEMVLNVSASDFAAVNTSTQPDYVSSISPYISFGIVLDGIDATPGNLANFNGVVGLNLTGVVGITDLAGNPLDTTPPATDQTYTLDNTVPTVTVEQAAGQTDPTFSLPIHFTATFSEPVSGFISDDVTLGGMANPVSANVNELAPNDGTTYDIAVTAISNDGTVTVSIPAGVVQDAAGNTNATSTSVDNTVTYATCASAIIVTNANDSGAGSLRQAMVNLCTGGTITFANDYTILLASPLTADRALTINGAGHSVTLDGQSNVRILTVDSGVTAVLNALTIDNGNSWPANGGGIYNQGNLTVTNSTITDNYGAEGGGIYNYYGTLTVTNSTFSGNTANWSGGGLYNYSGTLTVTNSTLSGNATVIATGAGLYNYGTLHYTNTIIANSLVGGDCVIDGGSIPTNVNNLVEDGGCSNNGVNFRTGDPNLGTLQNNGGPTSTYALLAGSPAIDAGTNTGCPPLDQRGVSRPLGASCDIGAYEYQDSAAPTVSTFLVTTPVNSLTIPITAFSGTDDVAVSGYLVTESSTQPAAGAAGWTSAVPGGYTVSADGSYTLYPWVKDASGNVSALFATPRTAVVDTTAPTITINNPDTLPATSKTITASTSDGTLTMSNTTGTTCDGTLAFVAYASQTFTSEANNGIRVCYRAVDALGNTSYSLSAAIAGIDTSAPVITITEPNTDPATSKTITASTSDGTLSMSNTTGTTCDGTLTFVPYASQTFTSEANNGIRVCYRAVDALGNTAYSLSNAISGIDTTGPTITITEPNTDPATSKTITASTSDGTLTMSNTTGATCDGTLAFVAYASQTFTSEANNGLRVCYRAVDALGNTAYSLSAAIAGIDTTSIEVALSGGVIGNPGTLEIIDLQTYTTHFTQIIVTFTADANNPADDTDPDDVTNPGNYLLIQPGLDGEYDTPNCHAYALDGLYDDDTQVPTGPVTYSNTDGYVATVTVNGGTPLPSGSYRLYICGSTSITDLAGNHLNGGADVILNFRITDPAAAEAIPSTGFAPNRMTALPEQTVSYTQSDLWLEIPKLGVKMDIVGVPLVDGNWDVSWLGKQAGWLEGSAYPTWDGNSVLTGHVVDANGKAGPFRYLNTLWYGDEIIVHAGGAQYVYAVRSVQQVGPGSTAALLKHEELPWVTLVTCRGYDEASNTYKYRVLVRAVLIKIK